MNSLKYCPFCHSDKVYQSGLPDEYYCPDCRTYMSGDELEDNSDESEQEVN